MKYQQFAPKSLNLEIINKSQKNKNEFDFLEEKNCDICQINSLQIYQRNLIHKKYFDTFNFYFAKPINEILANVQSDHVIMFKDLLFLNDDNEYLKRYYKIEEVPPRMSILSEFYTNQYKEPRPNLCIVKQGKIMQKRSQKLAKIFIQKFNQDEEQKVPPVSKRILPSRIFSENYSGKISSQSESLQQDKVQISYDSLSHNIFDITQSNQQPSQAYSETKENNNNNVKFVIQEVLHDTNDEKKMFLRENDAELIDAFDELNCIAKKQISQQAQSSTNNYIPNINHFRKKYDKEKPIQVASDDNFLSNYATNDPYASERSQKLQQKVPQLQIPAHGFDTQRISGKITSRQMPETSRLIQNNSSSNLNIKPQPVSNRKNQIPSQEPISDEILKKIYRKYLINKKKSVLKSEQSQSPQIQQLKKIKESQSSENSHHMRNQYIQNYCKNPRMKNNITRPPQSSSAIENTIVTQKQQNKVYLKQRTNNPTIKIKQGTNSQKVNFSQNTHSSPSTTQLFRKREKNSTVNISNYSSMKNMSKQIEQSKIDRTAQNLKNGTCSPSMLLRSLSSNPSMTQSPSRRLEIKINLNKLILKQDQEVGKPEGYWTQRITDQEETQTGIKTERNTNKMFQIENLNKLYSGLSPLQQKILKHKLDENQRKENEKISGVMKRFQNSNNV